MFLAIHYLDVCNVKMQRRVISFVTFEKHTSIACLFGSGFKDIFHWKAHLLIFARSELSWVFELLLCHSILKIKMRHLERSCTLRLIQLLPRQFESAEFTSEIHFFCFQKKLYRSKSNPVILKCNNKSKSVYTLKGCLMFFPANNFKKYV